MTAGPFLFYRLGRRPLRSLPIPDTPRILRAARRRFRPRCSNSPQPPESLALDCHRCGHFLLRRRFPAAILAGCVSLSGPAGVLPGGVLILGRCAWRGQDGAPGRFADRASSLASPDSFKCFILKLTDYRRVRNDGMGDWIVLLSARQFRQPRGEINPVAKTTRSFRMRRSFAMHIPGLSRAFGARRVIARSP